MERVNKLIVFENIMSSFVSCKVWIYFDLNDLTKI